MRLWLSGPRILRLGISLGREDLRPRLPSWRRYELRHGLQFDADGRGVRVKPPKTNRKPK